MNELFEVIRPFFEPALIAVIGYIASKIGQYFNTKISKDKQLEIDKIIKASVNWVESIYEVDVEYELESKFDKAKHRALFLINQKGFQVTEEYVDSMIEAFVFELFNKERKLEVK